MRVDEVDEVDNSGTHKQNTNGFLLTYQLAPSALRTESEKGLTVEFTCKYCAEHR
jgi:hypothetical protein